LETSLLAGAGTWKKGHAGSVLAPEKPACYRESVDMILEPLFLAETKHFLLLLF